jgi:hypothetical protein
MQVSTYITAGDYDTLGKHKPNEQTVPQFMAEILRNKAAEFRQETKP